MFYGIKNARNTEATGAHATKWKACYFQSATCDFFFFKSLTALTSATMAPPHAPTTVGALMLNSGLSTGYTRPVGSQS